MKFSIRDGLWATATFALVAAWFISSRQQTSRANHLQRQVQLARDNAARYAAVADEQRSITANIAERADRTQQQQFQEILRLRQVIKGSIHDQRDWFELAVAGNKIIAIGPGTTDTPEATLRTIEYAEAATGLEAKRLRHFMTPISQLRPNPGVFYAEE